MFIDFVFNFYYNYKNLDINSLMYRQLHLPVNAPLKTCFHVMSNVYVSGVKLLSFPAQT